MKVATYLGEKPSVELPAQVDANRVLTILERQLKVIEQITQTVVFIPAGTRITVRDLNGREEKTGPAAGERQETGPGAPTQDRLYGPEETRPAADKGRYQGGGPHD